MLDIKFYEMSPIYFKSDPEMPSWLEYWETAVPINSWLFFSNPNQMYELTLVAHVLILSSWSLKDGIQNL